MDHPKPECWYTHNRYGAAVAHNQDIFVILGLNVWPGREVHGPNVLATRSPYGPHVLARRWVHGATVLAIRWTHGSNVLARRWFNGRYISQAFYAFTLSLCCNSIFSMVMGNCCPITVMQGYFLPQVNSCQIKNLALPLVTQNWNTVEKTAQGLYEALG